MANCTCNLLFNVFCLPFDQNLCALNPKNLQLCASVLRRQHAVGVFAVAVYCLGGQTAKAGSMYQSAVCVWLRYIRVHPSGGITCH